MALDLQSWVVFTQKCGSYASTRNFFEKSNVCHLQNCRRFKILVFWGCSWSVTFLDPSHFVVLRCSTFSACGYLGLISFQVRRDKEVMMVSGFLKIMWNCGVWKWSRTAKVHVLPPKRSINLWNALCLFLAPSCKRYMRHRNASSTFICISMKCGTISQTGLMQNKEVCGLMT